MAQKKKSFKLRFQRSSPLLKCVVLATIILSIVAILTLRASIADGQGYFNDLRQEAAELEQENQQLRKNIAELGTVQSIKHIASKYLDLVDPDSIFFDPVG